VWVSSAELSQEEAKKASSGTVRQLADISLPSDLENSSSCYQVLELLKALSAGMNVNGISEQDFINRKLTAKANRQLEEPLIVASSCLPTWIYWLMSETPFLFPFETRYLFIQSTSFGYARLIARWQSLQMRNNTQNGTRTDSSSEQQPVLGRMERQKVRIMRNQMLESAVKILDLFGSSPTVLEIEYMGEEGTGMGPTLEFYASTSKEFCKSSLNLWRGSSKADKGYVDSMHGLFPKSLTKPNSRSSKKVINLFKTLGQFVAKGLLDFRIIDIPFSPAFFKVALDHVEPSPELLMVKYISCM
jgi:E3 ubiquitin-protein ligase TRIP12